MIELIHPKNGETVSLLTDEQKKFLNSDRSEITVESFDVLDLKVSGTENSIPKGVTFTWEADGEAELQISEDNIFTEYQSYFGNNTYTIFNLKCRTKYFWRITYNKEVSAVSTFETKDIFPRFLKVDGITNVRDCGGWSSLYGKNIKQGLLYRGSEMNSHLNITESGLRALREDLKLKSVLDIRGKTEQVDDIYKGNYRNIPGSSYNWLDNPASAKALFDFLCNTDNYPLYFHCWGGADRTGILAFMIGCVLGMNYDDLITDYEITSMSIYGPRSRNSEDFKSFITPFNQLSGNTHNEKAANYLISCGITRQQIDDFRNFMIEK